MDLPQAPEASIATAISHERTAQPAYLNAQVGDAQVGDAQVSALYELLRPGDKVSLIGNGGVPPVELTEVVRDLLLQIVEGMQEGKAISILSAPEDLTTQQAADVLGVSRPYFVKLLDSGKLPHHLTGSHRRVYLRDVRAYKCFRDQERHEALNRMAQEAERAGLYDRVLLPEE